MPQDEGLNSTQVGGAEERAKLASSTTRQLGLSERHYVRGVVVAEDIEESRFAEFLRSQNRENIVCVVNADGTGLVDIDIFIFLSISLDILDHVSREDVQTGAFRRQPRQQ